MEKRYIKGFEVNIHKVAKQIAEVEDVSDSRAQAAVRIVIEDFNREGYEFIGLGRVGSGPGDKVALVVVLAVGKDREELEGRELRRIDDTLQSALPYVLEGPYVWEEWR